MQDDVPDNSLDFWCCPPSVPLGNEWEIWLRAGADCGDSWCCWQYALLLKEHTDNANDLARAIRLLRKSANTGFAPAEFSLGVAYSFGEGVPERKSTAFEWYRRSANHGFPAAAYNLGRFLENGIGCVANISEAAHWYRIAANMGDSDAEVSLGNLYANKLIATGDTEYEDRVIYWYSLAAEHGNCDGLFNLAFCYRYGTGVKKNLKKYRMLLLRAAKLGQTDAVRAISDQRKKFRQAKRGRGRTKESASR